MNDSISKFKSDETILWDRLAELLHSEAGSETTMLMRQSGLLKSSNDTNLNNRSNTGNRGTSKPRAIGPWIPRVKEGNLEFVRENKWDKYLWLEKRDILTPEKKTGTYRVCLVGESVAAGMFFSPNINPAKVLNSILSQAKPNNAEKVEVIDLSRNAMRIELLTDVVDAASQLNPNVIVIFAGNNFCRNHTIGRPDQQNISKRNIHIANKEGATGLIKHFTDDLTQATQSAIDDLVSNIKSHSLEILWLIPATYSDWQRLAPIHWLGGGKTKEWHTLFKEALEALKLNKFQKVVALGQTMEKLDQKTSPTTQRLLATAFNNLECHVEAAKHYQQEVDVDCALERNSFLSPGIQSSVKTLIIESAKRYNFKYIDLQSIFSEYANSLSSPKNFFVDYCHLSVEGMQVAMSAVAAEIPGMVGEKWREILIGTNSFSASPKYIARGLFEAAIYTSHMQHRLEMETNVRDLRQRFYHALTLWKGLADTMVEYVHMRHGAVVTEVSQHAHQIVASANSLLDYGILNWIHGIDSQTIEAICGALDDAGRDGSALLAYYQEYDKKKLKIGIDLTNPRYIKYFGRDGVVDWDPERGTYRTQPYLRAYWPQIPFVFVAEKNLLLACQLTSRLSQFGGKGRRGTVKIIVNGDLVAKISVTDRWSRQYFTISTQYIIDGFNDIQLEWPEIPRDEDSAIVNEIRKLQTFGRANWYPIFGEIFSFRISPRN